MTVDTVSFQFFLTGLGGTHLVTFRAEGGHRLPPTNISPGDMVCIRILDDKGAGATECMQGFVNSLGEDGASITAAVEARYGDPVFSRWFGRPLRIDRISALADPTTYEVSLSLSLSSFQILVPLVEQQLCSI